jgi:hypothetical protein
VAKAGETVNVPANAPHGFRNVRHSGVAGVKRLDLGSCVVGHKPWNLKASYKLRDLLVILVPVEIAIRDAPSPDGGIGEF